MNRGSVQLLGVEVRLRRAKRQDIDIRRRGPHSETDLLVLANLLETLCIAHGVERCEVLGPRRQHHLVMVRRNFARDARDLGFSLTMIGAALGRHHTTILNLLP